MSTERILPLRGRPSKEPTVSRSVKVPVSLDDQYCHVSLKTGQSVHALMLNALRQYMEVAPKQTIKRYLTGHT